MTAASMLFLSKFLQYRQPATKQTFGPRGTACTPQVGDTSRLASAAPWLLLWAGD